MLARLGQSHLGKAPAYFANVRLGWQWLAETSGLAYCSAAAAEFCEGIAIEGKKLFTHHKMSYMGPLI